MSAATGYSHISVLLNEALEGLVTTNLTGVIFGSKVAIRNMLAQGGGCEHTV